MHIEVRDDISSMESVQESWLELWNHASNPEVFLHPLWTLAWWKHYGQGREACLLLVWDEHNTLAGLAPLCRCQRNPEVVEWIGSTDLSDSMDFLIRKGLEHKVMAALEKGLRKLLTNGSHLDLHCVADGSPTLEELNEMLSQGWDVRIDLEEYSPRVELPHSWEEFLQRLSSHHRHEIRRKIRKAERIFRPLWPWWIPQRGGKGPWSISSGFIASVNLKKLPSWMRKGSPSSWMWQEAWPGTRWSSWQNFALWKAPLPQAYHLYRAAPGPSITRALILVIGSTAQV